jgi:hypothetical protein
MQRVLAVLAAGSFLQLTHLQFSNDVIHHQLPPVTMLWLSRADKQHNRDTTSPLSAMSDTLQCYITISISSI